MAGYTLELRDAFCFGRISLDINGRWLRMMNAVFDLDNNYESALFCEKVFIHELLVIDR